MISSSMIKVAAMHLEPSITLPLAITENTNNLSHQSLIIARRFNLKNINVLHIKKEELRIKFLHQYTFFN